MRAVIYSTILPATLGLDAIARACGVETAAVIVPRLPPGEGDERRREMRRALVEHAPEHLDVCLAHDRGRLEALTRAYQPDLGLCLGYSWKIPPETLAVPRLGILNGHPSLLPRHRGPFPMAWTIRAGDDLLGMTWHLMDAEFDTGPVLAQASRPAPRATGLPELQPLLAELLQEALPAALERLLSGDRGDPQREEGATYAGPFGDDYRELDLSRPRLQVDRQVRAWQWMFTRDRGPYADVAGVRSRIVRASLDDPGEAALARLEAADGPVWVLEAEPVIA